MARMQSKQALSSSVQVIISGLIFAALGGCETVSSEPAYVATDIQQLSVPTVQPDYAGARVACVPYVNKTLAPYYTLGDAAVGILPEYLLEAGFQPIEAAENAELDSILAEFRYGESGKVDTATAVEIGKHLGAQYVFVGEVNSYRELKNTRKRHVAVMGYNLGRSAGPITYDLQVSGRLIDVETRAIVAAKTVAHNEEFRGEGFIVGTPWGSITQEQEIEIEQENSGKVLNHAFQRLVSEIVNQLNRRQAARLNYRG